ncbi:hypothetical protein Voc01_037280 [Virgisporangium ochraceum]|uniref:Uncharacterized protein n=1 Tax=Virgisporangium ochraceum TaxID=65505 RepID=A0A8J3ZWQ7_9ACTN|nr:hypothetical protein Voc01_037280 [Virgisporangium ochraceum]
MDSLTRGDGQPAALYVPVNRTSGPRTSRTSYDTRAPAMLSGHHDEVEPAVPARDRQVAVHPLHVGAPALPQPTSSAEPARRRYGR